jgi:hypothetical protein
MGDCSSYDNPLVELSPLYVTLLHKVSPTRNCHMHAKNTQCQTKNVALLLEHFYCIQSIFLSDLVEFLILVIDHMICQANHCAGTGA